MNDLFKFKIQIGYIKQSIHWNIELFILSYITILYFSTKNQQRPFATLMLVFIFIQLVPVKMSKIRETRPYFINISNNSILWNERLNKI